ncbi:putative minor extracellular protease vpr [Thozetella sp. PMI_491]|nr:putative minor extracellular protease vpr [Thozetella sp. PMI_491]
MHLSLSSLVVALCLAGSSAAQRRVTRREDPIESQTPRNETIAAKKFIIEFAEGVDPTEAVNSLTSVTNAKVLKVFNSDVFRGAAVESTEENIDSLQALQPISQAWSARKIKLAPSEPVQLFSATEVNADEYDIHYMTGVDKLHQAGILGKGATVAVVDTGVQYTHPALGGGFGPGFKVAGGYDLVGNDFWPSLGEKAPDNDPIDQLGHGTHVSGIIAGKSDTVQNGTDEETLIDAFIRAYDDGADIITSSIGGQSGWANGAWAVVASRLVDQGVVVTISAGNDGSGGPYAASSGSSGEHVLAIASVQASTLAAPAVYFTTAAQDGSTNTSREAYNSVFEWPGSGADGLPIVPLGFDTTVTDEACHALPADTPDFTGKIVLVRRGGCNFYEKQMALMPFNATYILIYTDESPLTKPSTPITSSLIAMVEADVGKAIIDAVQAGATVTANFTSDQADVIGVKNPYGGLASSYTSIGPTNELFIKPDVAAPGGLIFSTYIDGWAVLSGTSMACPYVAGIAALYVGQYGGRKTHGPEFAKTLAARILSSGDAIPWDDGLETGTDFGGWASAAQVGTGLVNATKVLTYETQLSFSKFALNDTHHFSRYHSLDVTNSGSSPVTYSFEVQDFGGVYSYNTDPDSYATPRVAWFEEAITMPQKWAPDVSLPNTFTLAPGETKTAKVSFNYPQGLDASRLPLYSGKVLVKGSNGESLGLPYLGLAADLHKDLGTMFQYPAGFPTLTSTRKKTPIAQKANFTFNLDPAVQDFPNLYERLQYATTELRWDIFEESWNERDWVYPPVVGRAGYIGAATTWAGNTAKTYFDPSIDDATDLTSFPFSYVPRDIVGVLGLRFWWLGQLANGTQIAPGKYKFRFAALVPFGTPQHSDNWDIFETPAFEVLPLQI